MEVRGGGVGVGVGGSRCTVAQALDKNKELYCCDTETFFNIMNTFVLLCLLRSPTVTTLRTEQDGGEG